MAVLNSAHIALAILAALIFIGLAIFARAALIAWIMRTDQRAHIESTTEYEESSYHHD